MQNHCFESTGLCGVCVEPQILFARKYRKGLNKSNKDIKMV